MEINSRLNKSRHSFDSAVVFRNMNGGGMSWRPSSFANIASDILRRGNQVLDSLPTGAGKSNKSTETQSEPIVETPTHKNNEKPKTVAPLIYKLEKKAKNVRDTIVNIVIVEAKGLPDTPQDGTSHGVYCKFRLGAQTYKSKSVLNKGQPQWRERFKLNLSKDQLLSISLWDKGKQKNFMGSCVLDLSTRERERTHDIWQELDGGYGTIHLSVTMCTTRNSEEKSTNELKVEDLQSKYAFYNLSKEIDIVGELHVKVIGAKGLYGKPNAYCTLELDNEKVQTHSVSCNPEPTWNKNYVFNIFDVTSSLELKVCDGSLNAYFNDFLGRVSVPLLRINNGETRWYALKDSSKRKSAKGNCPRIKLEMNIYWNPVIASLKLFRPKQVKYIAKHPKFDVGLVYKNVKFIRDTFDALYALNENIKRLFEWDDREFSTTVLCGWLTFWYYFDPWMTPLLIALLFPLFWYLDRRELHESNQNVDVTFDQSLAEDVPNGETMTEKIKGLPEMTFTITDGIEYLVSVAERLYNLATFKVPFLSFLTILLLVGSSVVLYLIPVKYLMMAFGLYKFGRKRLNPDRVLNNDLLDFISRVPDNKILSEWKELNVPEPNTEK